ncbi:CLRN3 protein, partial [Amia calva]|nr:CLRN3 protein [Amia calva]
MPSTTKTLSFLSGALCTAICASILCFTLASNEWIFSTMICKGFNQTEGNGTAYITFGLFQAVGSRSACPTFGTPLTITGERGGAPNILHNMVIAFIILSLISSALSFIITMYNSVSNPFETYMGPLGLYTTSSISAILILLSIILFVVNAETSALSAEIIKGDIQENVDLYDIQNTMKYTFYLLIPALVCSLLAITVIYIYEHARYHQQKEQERPTEDAPKEVMMY